MQFVPILYPWFAICLHPVKYLSFLGKWAAKIPSYVNYNNLENLIIENDQLK